MQVFYLRQLEKKAFPHLSTVCQLNLPWQRQQQTQVVQTSGNHPTLKAASGKAQRTLESLTRLASLQTQMQQREPRLWHRETVSTTFVFECFLSNYGCAIPKIWKLHLQKGFHYHSHLTPVSSTAGSNPQFVPDQHDLHRSVGRANSWPQEYSAVPHQHWSLGHLIRNAGILVEVKITFINH